MSFSTGSVRLLFSLKFLLTSEKKERDETGESSEETHIQESQRTTTDYKPKGFDHVACVTETHIHAVAVGADQILAAPSLLLARPVMFWEKLAEHKVTIAFAPNFFLALAVRELEKPSGHGTGRPQLGSLCDLRHVVSGGEANVVSTGNRFNEAVASLGGPEAATLRTAFGMTEVRHHLLFPPSTPYLQDYQEKYISGILPGLC